MLAAADTYEIVHFDEQGGETVLPPVFTSARDVAFAVAAMCMFGLPTGVERVLARDRNNHAEWVCEATRRRPETTGQPAAGRPRRSRVSRAS